MKVNQKNQILKFLKQGHTLTQAEAINFFGCYRLSAIINCLRNAGYEIVTHKEKNKLSQGTHARYELLQVQS